MRKNWYPKPLEDRKVSSCDPSKMYLKNMKKNKHLQEGTTQGSNI